MRIVSRALVSVLVGLAPNAMAAGKPATPAGEESASERRAVRGTPVDNGIVSESPELREVRRFEEQAFPRNGQVPVVAPDPDETPQPLPPGLAGRWKGTGDIPAELRTPEVARRPGRAPAAPESEWLRGLALPDFPIRWEPQVLRYLDYFKNDTRGRAIMASWLRRLGRYRAVFEQVMEREKVPKDLIYLAMVESGFETGAVSRVGAGGVWQFMPGAARVYGMEVSYWVDSRRDPERSAEAAARYLSDLYVRFGSWHLAFAAYNAGYGAVLKSIARYNTNDYWELCRHEAGLPWESSVYVPKILAAAIVGHNRAAFGFSEVASDPPLAYDKVQVAAGTTLATVARAAGTRIEVLQGLNPELVRDRTPPERGLVTVRIPAGSAGLYAEAIEGSRAPADRVESLVLRFGETLDDVARARGVSVKELRRLNEVKDSNELRGGATIVVPARATVAAEPAAEPADEPMVVAVPDRIFSYEGLERVFYRTRDGDSLEEIGNVFGVSEDSLTEWNNLDPGAKLHPKMVLQLFVRKDFDRAGVTLLDSSKLRVVTLGSEEFLELEAAKRGKTRLQYTARPGDTLAKIARRYGLSPGDLARINRLSYNSELGEGQHIVVYSPTKELPREITVGRSVHQKRPTEKGGAGNKPAPASTKPTAARGKGVGAPVVHKAAPRKVAAPGQGPKKAAPTSAKR